MKIALKIFHGHFGRARTPSSRKRAFAGELLVAKVRLSLATLLFGHTRSTLFFPVERKEGLVGISLLLEPFFLSVVVYR